MARSHDETVYMQQSASLESHLRGRHVWGPRFRHLSTEAGSLDFECRWPFCDHRSFTVEADIEHLRSHVVRKQSEAFRTRLVARLRDDLTDPPVTLASGLPTPVLTLRPAPVPSRNVLLPPCPSTFDNEPSQQQWRTSKPRTGNRIPLDQRRGSGGAGVQFKCEWPNCSYIALRRSHLVQHVQTHTGARPFGTTASLYEDYLAALICGRCLAQLARGQGVRIGPAEMPLWPSTFVLTQATGAFPISRLLFFCPVADLIRLTYRRRHLDHRPFKCMFPGCSYAAAQKTTLSSHMQRHKRG